MSADVEEDVHVAFETEVKSHVFGDARLPDVRTFIILFGAERRVADILQEITNLFVKCRLYLLREFFKLTIKRFGGSLSHFSK